jgi:hypothetical protein
VFTVFSLICGSVFFSSFQQQDEKSSILCLSRACITLSCGAFSFSCSCHVCVCIPQTNGEYWLLSFIIQIIIYLIFVVHFIRGSFLTLLLEILPPVLLCVCCLCWVSFVSEYAYY